MSTKMTKERSRRKKSLPAITENSCRMCLKSNCDESDELASKFVAKYKICIGIEINVQIDVPKKVCKACSTFLQKFWTFRNKCLATEKRLNMERLTLKIEPMEEVDEGPEEYLVKQEYLEEEKANNVENLLIKEEIFAHELEVKTPIIANKKKKKKSVVKTKRNTQNLKPVICDLCGSVCSNQYYFKEHYALHFIDKNGPKFYCDICITNHPENSKEDYGYLTKKRITNHMQRVHMPRNRNYPCSVCGKVLASSSSLDFHFKQCHVDPKEYQFECTICGKRFHKKTRFTYHQMKHAGLKPFKCKFCDMCFNTTSHRANHTKSIHKPTREECKHCGKVFNSVKYLNQHLQTHKQEFSCPICPGKMFSLTTTLRAHIKSAHPAFPLPPLGTVLKNFDWNSLLANV